MSKNLYIDASHPSEVRVVLKNDKHIEDVMVWGEATVFFPLLISYIFSDVDKLNRKGKELNNIFRDK